MTGAAGGIGRAISLRLGRLGYRLVLLDRDDSGLRSLQADLSTACPGDHETVAADVSDADAWRGLADTLRHDGARVELLVQTAGRLLSGKLIDCDPNDLRSIVDTNLTGMLLGAREIGPLLAADSGGASPLPRGMLPPLPRGMLGIASIFAAVSPPQFAAYNATKAGVVALGETLHGEWAPLGLTVTTVLPGVTPTGLFDAAVYSAPKLREQVARRVEQAELTAEAVADAALEAYRRRRIVAPIGRRAGRYHWLKRWLPTMLLKRVARAAERELDG
ncbi:putative oxidoreductase [Planctomycetes bacterium MalM25]|nr:putative oxidoreductase [Planctomycetes bacterium MalM25]